MRLITAEVALFQMDPPSAQVAPARRVRSAGWLVRFFARLKLNQSKVGSITCLTLSGSERASGLEEKRGVIVSLEEMPLRFSCGARSAGR